MPLTNAAVAAAVRAELARAGISGRQLSLDLGWSAAFVHRRIHPTDPAPFNVEDVGRIADYLGIPVSRLIVDQPAAAAG